jgi:cytochrome c oxidase subunit 2
MLNIPGQPVVNNGVRELGSDPSDGPSHLEVDNRLVVPVGELIRFQITASDVIHSFAVPSLWFKLDAVPGRINEKVVQIDEPGVYYGQCSELCGAKHGYMPIAVEALPRDEFNAWVLPRAGGKVDHQEPAKAAPGADGAPADPEALADPEAPADPAA